MNPWLLCAAVLGAILQILFDRPADEVFGLVVLSNTLLSPTIITKASLARLKNKVTMPMRVHRNVESIFNAEKPGTTVTIRLPNRFTVSTSMTLDVQDQAEPSFGMTLDTWNSIGMKFDDKELALKVERFTERYLDPAVEQLANEIDAGGYAQYKYVSGWVGTAATTPSTYATSVQLVSQFATEMGWPKDGNRNLALNPAAYHAIVASQPNFFNQQYARKALAEGEQETPFGGWDAFESANVKSHTVGVYSGTILTEGAGADLDTVTDTDGWGGGSDTITVGDVFTIASVYAVNPVNRASTGALKTFVANTAGAVSSGDIDIAHTPTIKSSGAYQNVDSAPANDKAITIKTGATGAVNPQNLAWHRDAFALAMATLTRPENVWCDVVTSEGLSIRISKQWDINNAQYPCRLDALYGWATPQEYLAVRLSG